MDYHRREQEEITEKMVFQLSLAGYMNFHSCIMGRAFLVKE